jgi:mannose-1-phosphate guanylyltransferase
LLQPHNRGTAPGVFLPLSFVRAQDPAAVAVIFPSDHFVYPERVFEDAIARAVASLDRLSGRVLLIGVRPTAPEPDYGWIVPAETVIAPGVRKVRRFVEKPPVPEAEKLFRTGGLWNTLIVVAEVRTLWTLGRYAQPDMMALFEWLSYSVGTGAEAEVIDEIYRIMPALNFSSDVLERTPDQLVVWELEEVVWSDWGRPERIDETLGRLGIEPRFPRECLAS